LKLRKDRSHVSVYSRAFFVDFVFVVVVDAETGEEDLVLVFAQRAFEEELGISAGHVAILNQGPKGCVVEVVDVAYRVVVSMLMIAYNKKIVWEVVFMVSEGSERDEDVGGEKGG